ncbi:unnamed protein product [Rhizophagus irregularis]|nr:unnamed protein product [Rhizophagus irregularis]
MICKKLIQHQPMRPSPCSSVWIFFQNFAVSFENAREGQGVGRFILKSGTIQRSYNTYAAELGILINNLKPGREKEKAFGNPTNEQMRRHLIVRKSQKSGFVEKIFNTPKVEILANFICLFDIEFTYTKTLINRTNTKVETYIYKQITPIPP